MCAKHKPVASKVGTLIAIYRISIYNKFYDFKNKTGQDIFDGVSSKASRKIPTEIHDKIRRLLDQINAATKIDSLLIPPGNNLEKLKGSLKNYWSIRANKQWRIIFKWENNEAIDIDIVDYH